MEDIQLVKIIVVGDANVGKTSLLTQYCWKQFDNLQSPTIGCDFQTKVIKKGTCSLKLQLWDIAGQEKFQSVSRLFIRGSAGCLVVSDVTNEQSLLNTVAWKNIVDANADDLPIFLLQNKTDLLEDQQPKQFQTMEYLKQFSNNNGFTKYYQVSVKKNEKLDVLINDLVDEMIQKRTIQLDNGNLKSSFFIQPQNRTSSVAQKKQEKDGCC